VAPHIRRRIVTFERLLKQTGRNLASYSVFFAVVVTDLYTCGIGYRIFRFVFQYISIKLHRIVAFRGGFSYIFREINNWQYIGT
jgi:hypothetical protein